MRVLKCVVACCLAAVLALTGCGTSRLNDSSSGRGFGQEVDRWLRGYDTALDEGHGEHAVYLAPDVVVDARVVDARLPVHGRRSAVRVQQQICAGSVEHGQAYLGATEVVRVATWTGDGGAGHALVQWTLTDEGIAGILHAAPAWSTDRGERSAVGPQLASDAARVAEAYVQAWNGSTDEVAVLYGEQATVWDSLRGVTRVGEDDISARAGAPAPGTVGIASVGEVYPPSSTSDAEKDQPCIHVYQAAEGGDGAVEVWVHLKASGLCRHDVAVALSLDRDMQLLGERRYHALDTLRRCHDVEEPIDGWWMGRDLPRPFSDRVTGILDTEAGPVQICNGGADYTQVPALAFDRFARGGLAAPTVSVVRFDPLDPRCLGRCALAECTPGATSIVICADAAGIQWSSPRSGGERDGTAYPTWTPLWPTRLVLHELAHVWLAEHTEATTRQQYMQHVGVTSWADLSQPWADRGVERAAETLAWGLVGRVSTPTTIGSPDCDQLSDGFRLLAHAEPLTPCR